jgi:membrane-associated phospholipid phosphatase
MKQLFKQAPYFWLAYGLTLVCALFFVLFLERGQAVMWFNDHYQPWANHLFYYGTHLGNGIFLAIVALALLLYRYWLGLTAGIAFIAQGIVVQSLKRTVFDSWKRPLGVLSNPEQVVVPAWLEAHTHFTFPSGHTASAFCLFTILAIQVQGRPVLQLGCFGLAVIGGLSRIYLLQHFLGDVVAGALLGTLIGVMVYTWLVYYPPSFLSRLTWWPDFDIHSAKSQ